MIAIVPFVFCIIGLICFLIPQAKVSTLGLVMFAAAFLVVMARWDHVIWKLGSP